MIKKRYWLISIIESLLVGLSFYYLSFLSLTAITQNDLLKKVNWGLLPLVILILASLLTLPFFQKALNQEVQENPPKKIKLLGIFLLAFLSGFIVILTFFRANEAVAFFLGGSTFFFSFLILKNILNDRQKNLS